MRYSVPSNAEHALRLLAMLALLGAVVLYGGRIAGKVAKRVPA